MGAGYNNPTQYTALDQEKFREMKHRARLTRRGNMNRAQRRAADARGTK